MARRSTFCCWAVARDWPSSGINWAIDCTSTGGGGGGTGGPGGALGGGGTGAPGGTLAGSGIGTPGWAVVGGREGTAGVGAFGSRCGRDRTSPVRRLRQTTSTPREVSASRTSCSWLRFRMFLLKLTIVPVSSVSALDGSDTTL